MRTRNKSTALRDKTPGNTPQRQRRTTDKVPFSSAKKTFASRSIHGRRVDTDEILPKNFLTSQASLVSPTPVHPPIESTPITLRHHRARLSTTTMKPSMKVPMSPLPPSSPPSSDGEGDEDLPILPSLQSRVNLQERVELEDEGVDENKENEEHELHPLSEALLEEPVDENVPDEDPFGFFAVERDLKVRREMRNRGSLAPESKGKGVARERAPFKELSFDPSASPKTSRVTPRRPPTPYHPSDDLRESDGLRAPPSDDLEDMYTDPATPVAAADFSFAETANRSIGRLELRREMEAEEDAEAEAEAESVSAAPAEVAPEPESPAVCEPSTPRPHHVADIPPLPSPFSSQDGTPSKDYSLPSSPSPVKRPSAPLPKPPPTVKKSAWGDRFKAVTASAPPAKRTRTHVTVAKENASEDPAMSTSVLLNRLPKRPVKRATKVTTKTTTTTRTSSTRKTAPIPTPKATAKSKGKQRAEEVEAESIEYVSDSADESPDETPLATRKRKAAAKAKPRPTKRAKVEVVLPTRRSLRQTKPASTAVARAKGKGREREKAAPASRSVARLEDEDSVRVQDRIDVDVRMLISVQVGRGASASSAD
ncbi:hypothetical protein EIP86_010039 [Pleurotus ostreatoroseus]|nr:hypothetical protein EIP86_010039 [Pleurotus ostreatoroseus]